MQSDTAEGRNAHMLILQRIRTLILLFEYSQTAPLGWVHGHFINTINSSDQYELYEVRGEKLPLKILFSKFLQATKAAAFAHKLHVQPWWCFTLPSPCFHNPGWFSSFWHFPVPALLRIFNCSLLPLQLPHLLHWHWGWLWAWATSSPFCPSAAGWDCLSLTGQGTLQKPGTQEEDQPWDRSRGAAAGTGRQNMEKLWKARRLWEC